MSTKWLKTVSASLALTVAAGTVSAETLRVVTDPSFVPFEMMDQETGEMIGFDMEIIREVADRVFHGGKLRITHLHFALQELLILYSSGRTTGLVINLGHDITMLGVSAFVTGSTVQPARATFVALATVAKPPLTDRFLHTVLEPVTIPSQYIVR